MVEELNHQVEIMKLIILMFVKALNNRQKLLRNC